MVQLGWCAWARHGHPRWRSWLTWFEWPGWSMRVCEETVCGGGHEPPVSVIPRRDREDRVDAPGHQRVPKALSRTGVAPRLKAEARPLIHVRRTAECLVEPVACVAADAGRIASWREALARPCGHALVGQDTTKRAVPDGHSLLVLARVAAVYTCNQGGEGRPRRKRGRIG